MSTATEILLEGYSPQSPPILRDSLIDQIVQGLSPRQVRGWQDEWLPRNDGHPYDPQQSPGLAGFHASKAKFRALVSARGSGKTAAGSQEACQRIRDGKDGIVLSPSIPHFNTSTREEFWKWIPWNHVEVHQKSEKWMLFDTGAKVYYGGIEDEDRWRGPNVNWLWFDEAARKPTEKAWIVSIAGVRIGHDAAAWITTTPRGKRHWLYRMFVLQQTPPEVQELLDKAGYKGPLYEYFHTTIHDNANNLDPVFYASMVSAYTGKFKEQELEGQFVETAEGIVYEDFGPENITSEAEFDPKRGPVEIAYDDGFATSPRVFLFIQRGDDGEVFVFDEIFHLKHLSSTCVGEAKDLLKTHCRKAGLRGDELELKSKIAIAVGDPSAAELRSAFRYADIPARGGQNPVVEGIKRVRTIIADGRGYRRLLVHPRCQEMIREFSEDYRYPDPEEGPVRGDMRPIKEHDHSPDALRYWAMTRTRFIG